LGQYLRLAFGGDSVTDIMTFGNGGLVRFSGADNPASTVRKPRTLASGPMRDIAVQRLRESIDWRIEKIRKLLANST
jgi:hypothetical protein